MIILHRGRMPAFGLLLHFLTLKVLVATIDALGHFETG